MFKLPETYKELRQGRCDAFKGFRAARSEVFTIQGNGGLDLDVGCYVAVIEGPKDRISVQIDADPKDLALFSVSQEGDTIKLRQAESVGGAEGLGSSKDNIAFNNSTISSLFSTGDNARREILAPLFGFSLKRPRILISAPSSGDIAVNMAGKPCLFSSVPHKDAFVSFVGEAHLAIAARNLTLGGAGSMCASAFIGGGKLDVDLTGIFNSVCVQGKKFSEVKASLAVGGILHTYGVVEGGYDAEARGDLCAISHHGGVRGKVTRCATGGAVIDIG